MLSVYTTWIECSRNYYAASQPTFHLATAEAHLNTVRHSSIHFHPELCAAVTCCEATAPFPNGIKLWLLSVPSVKRRAWSLKGTRKIHWNVVKLASLVLNAVVQNSSKSWVCVCRLLDPSAGQARGTELEPQPSTALSCSSWTFQHSLNTYRAINQCSSIYDHRRTAATLTQANPPVLWIL